MYLYLGTSDNKLGIVKVDDETGDLVESVEVMEPVVDPSELPPKKKGLFAMPPRADTEWVLKHPKMNRLYAFTSFMSSQYAIVTTYEIDAATGKLKKLGACQTGGFQAAHAVFSPDASLIAIAHHNDGRLSFFECSKKSNDGILKAPLKVFETPEVVPGTRSNKMPLLIPSLHHLCYSPNGEFLFTVDSSSQSRVWTYKVDKQGMPVSEEPIQNPKLKTLRSSPFGMATCISWAFGLKARIRRAVLHPSGLYLYVLFEFHCLVHVYEITSEGKIVPDCLQEIPIIDEAYFDKFRLNGIAMTGSAEMVATDTGVWVSNRGMALLGRAESSIRFLKYQDGGKRLEPALCLNPAGPVRHFEFGLGDKADEKLLVGINAEKPGLVETFVKDSSASDSMAYKKTGEAAVGLDVLCVVPVSEHLA